MKLGSRVWALGLPGQPSRLLLAVLTLLASYAYLTREPGAALAGPGMTHQAMTQQAALMTDMAGMAGLAPSAHTPVSQPEHHPGQPPSHDHRAHCPFCFTAAFALEAQGLNAPLAAAARTGLPVPPLPGLPRPSLLHADARAPPA